MNGVRVGFFALLLLGGCASRAPIVQFAPAGSLPEQGLPARVARAAPTPEPAGQLASQGYVRLGMMEVFADGGATAALLEAAARHGADLVTLRIDNRRSLIARNSRQQCVEVLDPGQASDCLRWNEENGVCRLWSAPIAFECGEWKTVSEHRYYVISQAELWRREALAAAIVRGETAVRGALAAGAKADAPWLPLHLAIDRNDAAAMRALIDAGAPADARALGHAIDAGNLSAIALLLSAGAPVDGEYYRREPAPGRYTTALVDAVRQGRLEVVGLLLDRGADANAAPDFGSTPLREAVAAGNLELVRRLLARGADPELKGFDAVSAIEEAVQGARSAPEDYREMLRVLQAAARK